MPPIASSATFGTRWQLWPKTPGIGNYCKDLADEPLRFWRVYTYLIIYRSESKPIEIVRVLSAYRDIRKLLD